MHVTLKPEIDNHVANKAYVDGEVKAVGDALESKADKSHKHLSSDIEDAVLWVGASHPNPRKLISTDGSGYLTITVKPEKDTHVANKGYVDEVVKVATDAVAKKQDALDIETASVGPLSVTRFGPLVVAVANRIGPGTQAEKLPAQFRPSSAVYAALSPLASGSNDSPYLHIRSSGEFVVWNAPGECRGSVAYVV